MLFKFIVKHISHTICWKRKGLVADVFSLDFLLSRCGRCVAENMIFKAHDTKFLAASNFYKCVKLHSALCICL